LSMDPSGIVRGVRVPTAPRDRIVVVGRRSLFAGTLFLCILAIASVARAGSASEALRVALRGTQASGIVLDLQTGKLKAGLGKVSYATPGSTLKPLLLEYALEHGIVSAQSQVLCHRKLRIGARSLPCTHPADEDVFAAEKALAESCNTYFADLGRRFTGPSLEAALQKSRLIHRGVTDAARNERELTVLGLENVSTSPLESAEAYRQLALSLPAGGPVARGLAGSVEYGMADPASVQGLTILGKTGTASNPGEAWTHGWFAGILPGRLVLVVYLPRGDGGAAARLANVFFAQIKQND
jgi:membrane peptidoglycan carboxypeptidase